MHCTNSKLANSHAMAGGGLTPAKTQIKHAVACANYLKGLKGIQRSKRGLANSITLHANWHWCLIIPQSLKCLTQRSRHLKESGLLRATHASGVSGPSWVTAGGAHGHPKPKRRPGNNGDIGGGGGKTVKKNTGAEGGGSSTSTTSSSPSLPLPLPPLPLPLPLPLRAQGQLPAT